MAPVARLQSASLSDAVLTLLRWALLGLIYLFFARVLQAAWAAAGTRASSPVATAVKAATPRRRVKRKRRALVVIEPPDQAGSVFRLDSELTMGRAASCSVTLDDTYVSQMHAKLTSGDTGVVLTDLGSTNGTYLNRQRVTAPVSVQPGDRIQIGSTLLELQT